MRYILGYLRYYLPVVVKVVIVIILLGCVLWSFTDPEIM